MTILKKLIPKIDFNHVLKAKSGKMTTARNINATTEEFHKLRASFC